MTETIERIAGRHAGGDVFVCGTGTSMSGFDWPRLNACTCIALNDAIHARGFKPTYHLFVDAGLYARYIKAYPLTTAVVPAESVYLLEGAYGAVATFTHVRRYERVKAATCDPRWPDPQGRLVLPGADVREDSDELFCNHTVATAGVQLAWRLGARRIFLLGCDAYTREQVGGGNYFDGRRSVEPHDRPVAMGDGRYRTSAHIWWDMEMWRVREWFAARDRYLGPWPDAGVYNCSAASTLTAWDKVELEDAIDAQGGLTWQPHSQLSVVTRRVTPSLT